MNTATVNQTAIVTITYEYIPDLPSSFHKVTPVWLDIGGCGTSEKPAQNDTTFTYASPVWKANATGRLTTAIGHLHDGGTHLNILKNSQTMCNSVAAYGQNPGYMNPMDNMNMSGMSMESHISYMSGCSDGQVNLGDNMTVIAYYNTTEYAPMVNTDGTLTDIMGIGILYLAQNETGTSSASPTSSGVASSTSKAAGSVMTAGGGSTLLLGAVGVMAFGFA